MDFDLQSFATGGGVLTLIWAGIMLLMKEREKRRDAAEAEIAKRDNADGEAGKKELKHVGEQLSGLKEFIKDEFSSMRAENKVIGERFISIQGAVAEVKNRINGVS